MADNNSGDIAVATDFPTAGSPPMDNDNSSNNNSSGNTGNHLIFSIQDGIEVTVLGTGKKPLCADEPATLLLYEYRLCVKRLQDDRLLFDMHIKQVDLILSAGAQNVDVFSMDSSLPTIKISGIRSDSAVKFGDLITLLRLQKTRCFPNCRHIQLTDQARLQQLLTSRNTSAKLADDTYNTLQLAVFPASRFKDSLDDQYTAVLRDTDKRPPYGGFVRTYRAMCNFYGFPLSASLLLTIETSWSANMARQLTLTDWKTTENLLPILSALEHNQWFNRVSVDGAKINSGDLVTALCQLAAHNTTLNGLALTNCPVGRDFIVLFAEALLGNKYSQLNNLDFTGTSIDDRGLQALNRLAAKFTKGEGFTQLRLGNCGLAKKLTAPLLVSLKGSMGTLVELDLSRNLMTLDSELALREYLAGPNQLESLKLSDCHIERLETLIGALSLGCLRSLQSLWLDGNSFQVADSAAVKQQQQQQHHVSSAFDTFFRSCQSLRFCDLSRTMIGSTHLAHLFGCISVNIELQGLHLKLRSNGFGLDTANLFKNIFADATIITELDISGNTFGSTDGLHNLFHALFKHRSLCTLIAESVFTVQQQDPHALAKVMQELCDLIKLQQLTKLSLADNHLSQALYPFFDAFSESRLVELDLSGNNLCDDGVYHLAQRMIRGNFPLSVLSLERNKISLNGWYSLVIALQVNQKIQKLRIPLKDLSAFLKSDPEMTEKVQEQLNTCLYRNSRLVAGKVEIQQTSPMAMPYIQRDDLFVAVAADEPAATQTTPALTHLNRGKPRLPKRIGPGRMGSANDIVVEPPAPVSTNANPRRPSSPSVPPVAAPPYGVHPVGFNAAKRISVDQQSFVSLGLRQQTTDDKESPNDVRDQLAKIMQLNRVVIDSPVTTSDKVLNEEANASVDTGAPVPLPRSGLTSVTPNSPPAPPPRENISSGVVSPSSILSRKPPMDTALQTINIQSSRMRPLSVMLSAAGQLKRSANQFNDEWKSTKVQWIKSKAAELGIEVSVTPETFIDWTKDGVSLMEFVEALSAAVLSEEVEFPRYRKNASLFAHKLDNFAQLVSYLRRHHKFEGEVTGEDLVNGVPKKLEILFQALESWQQLNASLRSVHIEEDKEI